MNDYSELKADAENGEFPKSVAKKILELIADLEVTDKIIAERNRLMSSIPACPIHGPCVPHAIEWVEKAILMLRELKADNEALRKDSERLDWLLTNCDLGGPPYLDSREEIDEEMSARDSDV